jgi:hypothetical protein
LPELALQSPKRGYQWGCDMSGKYSAEWWEKVSLNRQATQVNMSPSLAPAAEPEREHPKSEAHVRRTTGSSRSARRTMSDHLA